MDRIEEYANVLNNKLKKELPYTKEEVILSFKNTQLEPFVDWVYCFWQAELFSDTSTAIMKITRDRFQKYVLGCCQVAEICIAAKQKVFSGKRWRVDVEEDLSMISNRLESCLYDKLLEFEAYFLFHHPDDEPDSSNIGRWGRLLSPFPRINQIEFNKEAIYAKKYCCVGCQEVFSEKVLVKISEKLKECVNISKHFDYDDSEKVINRFLQHMLEKDIPLNRGMYRELYKALDMFEAIPDYIKHSHSTTTSNDPQSNYIKSLITTIRKNSAKNERE